MRCLITAAQQNHLDVSFRSIRPSTRLTTETTTRPARFSSQGVCWISGSRNTKSSHPGNIEVFFAGDLADLLQGAGFDLADAFLGHAVPLADLFQGQWLGTIV